MMKFLYSSSTVLAGAILVSLAAPLQAASDVMTFQVETGLASSVVLNDSAETNYLKITLTGASEQQVTPLPLNIAIVVDSSSSMSAETLDKISKAIVELANTLTPEDVLSVVSYGNEAKVIVPASNERNSEALKAQLAEGLISDGRSALFAGVSKGLMQMKPYLDKHRVNQLFLISDGQANMGPTTVSELSQLAEVARKQGVSIMTFGWGSDYNASPMQSMAIKSDGLDAPLNSVDDLHSALQFEVSRMRNVLVNEVEASVTFNQDITIERLLGREGFIQENQLRVPFNEIYADEEKSLFVEFTQPAMSAHSEIAQLTITYHPMDDKGTKQWQQGIAVDVSTNKQTVEQARNQQILVEVAMQKSACAHNEAVLSMEGGDYDKAYRILQEQSGGFSVLCITTPNVMNRITEKEAAPVVDEGEISQSAITADEK